MEYVPDFGLNLTPVQQEFGNVIKAAWQGVNTLDELSQAKKGCKAHKKTIIKRRGNVLLGILIMGKYWQGYYLFEGINGEIDKEKGINLLKESADAGIKDAQFRYAFSLREKESFDKNEFVKYLTLAADSGLDNSRYNLGDLYINGKLDIEKMLKRGYDT